MAREKAKIPASQDVAVVIFPAPRSPFDRFLEDADGWDGMTSRAPVSPVALSAQFRARMLAQSRTVWARLPYTVELR